MSKLKTLTAGAILSVLTYTLPAIAQSDTITAHTVVTVIPKSGDSSSVQRQDLKVSADGKASEITAWHPAQDALDGLEFVVLIDNSATSSIGLQLNDLAKFIQSMPP